MDLYLAKYSPYVEWAKESHCQIRCLVKRNWKVDTPEEVVRQQFLAFLTKTVLVPAYLIDVEAHLSRFYSEVNGRVDVLVYGDAAWAHPLLLVECKAPFIRIDWRAHVQVDEYFSEVMSTYVAIVNGTHCTLVNMVTHKTLPSFPVFEKLLSGSRSHR